MRRRRTPSTEGSLGTSPHFPGLTQPSTGRGAVGQALIIAARVGLHARLSVRRLAPGRAVVAGRRLAGPFDPAVAVETPRTQEAVLGGAAARAVAAGSGLTGRRGTVCAGAEEALQAGLARRSHATGGAETARGRRASCLVARSPGAVKPLRAIRNECGKKLVNSRIIASTPKCMSIKLYELSLSVEIIEHYALAGQERDGAVVSNAARKTAT
jgi:hypothetical protein